MAQRLGADEFVDYTTQDYVYMLTEYDYVIDTEEPAKFINMKILKPGGKLVSLNAGPNARYANQIPELATTKKILFSLLGAPFGGIAKWQRKSYDFIYVQPNGQQLAAITQYFEKTNINPVIDSEYSFDEVNAAIAKIATGHSLGKVILIVDDRQPSPALWFEVVTLIRFVPISERRDAGPPLELSGRNGSAKTRPKATERSSIYWTGLPS
ncbi:zinc-binding dehydrogenase [Paenibacillus sp. sptzw28]|nr:zinc-binding dehydrogenase [Paenibacillus sp. sptzw28]